MPSQATVLWQTAQEQSLDIPDLHSGESDSLTGTNDCQGELRYVAVVSQSVARYQRSDVVVA